MVCEQNLNFNKEIIKRKSIEIPEMKIQLIGEKITRIKQLIQNQ